MLGGRARRSLKGFNIQPNNNLSAPKQTNIPNKANKQKTTKSQNNSKPSGKLIRERGEGRNVRFIAFCFLEGQGDHKGRKPKSFCGWYEQQCLAGEMLPGGTWVQMLPDNSKQGACSLAFLMAGMIHYMNNSGSLSGLG